MKKRFLPFSLLMAVLFLGQVAIADNGGHYVPRTQGNATAEQFLGSLRANQHTGLIDPAAMLKAMQNDNKGTNGDLYWISMGPDNMGGQTTAVLYDKNSNVVYIGSKGGGVYKTYNFGVTWHQVGNQNLMVSCMTQGSDGTIYVGTGDCGSKASTYNGLSQQSYTNSFIGTGIYTIDANETITPLVSTTPVLNEVTDWSFVNDLAFSDGNLLAATEAGLKYSSDKGQTWTMLIEGVAMEVRAASDGTIVASVDGKIYIGSVDNMVCHSANSTTAMSGDTLIPKAAGLLDIAIAPSNENVIFASCINNAGNHAGIYVSYNKGVNWEVAMPSVTNNLGNSVYEGYGLYNHGIVVDPTNEGRLFILGHNLWKIERTESGTGNYLCEMVTGSSVYYLPSYIHVGLHALAFNPKNPTDCYFGTDGGVYRGTASNGNFTFSYSNRNYVTTRMFNVAFCGKDTRVLAAGIDHGTVIIEGDENANTMSHGIWINPSGLNSGLYDNIADAGPCAISCINPNTIFVTYVGGGLQRSDKAGEDWVSVNFTSSSTLNSGNGISTSSYRLPILLHENFNDALNPATIWFKNTKENTIANGTTIQCISNNKFPFYYTLSAPLAVGDSIEIHDPISAKFYLTYTNVLYMTRGALDFGTETEWYILSNKDNDGVTGEPLSMGISADGDNLFIGTKEGKLFRVSNLNTAVDSISSAISDTTGAFQVTTTEIALLNTDQCVTSVAVDPRDANKVIVTLGNYLNDSYVLYSTNALSDEPTFTVKQGNLPKMPVYSSVIEMATGDVILGTEHGIYSTTNIAASEPNWVSDGHMIGDVPVMELKQQLLQHEDEYETLISPNDTVINLYPGVHNKGIIYAATYGRGVFRCENYKQESGAGVPDMPVAAETSVSMYPNPVRGEASVNFTATSAHVNYQVFDLTGRMVMSQDLGRFAAGEQEIKVNMSELSAGSYILRLNQGNNSSCVKFLVY